METGTLLRDGSSRQQLPAGHAELNGSTPLPAEPQPRLAIRDLSVAFRGAGAETRVVHGIDLDVPPGRTLGIVGESGCGKSVTMLASMRLLGPRARVEGRILLDGNDLLALPEEEMVRRRGRRMAMIFQDPMSSLNPVHTIGTQIREALALHRGMSGETATAEVVRLLDRVGITGARRRVTEYPHQLSGGMSQRAMIAMALAGEPEVLIADEPTTALDVTIQAQILDLLRGLQEERAMSIVLITHDLGVVSHMAHRVAVMYCGRVVEQAATADLFADPQHPYTRGLLASLPVLGERAEQLRPIPGTVPEAGKLPPGCSFAPRCPEVQAGCQRVPSLCVVGPRAHAVACVIQRAQAA
jgi:peptide/nickel transport system ATP-binding protein